MRGVAKALLVQTSYQAQNQAGHMAMLSVPKQSVAVNCFAVSSSLNLSHSARHQPSHTASAKRLTSGFQVQVCHTQPLCFCACHTSQAQVLQKLSRSMALRPRRSFCMQKGGKQPMSSNGGGLWRGKEGTGWLTVALEPGTRRPAPNSLMMIPDLRRARPPPPGALGLSGPPDGPACTYTHAVNATFAA